MKRLPMAFLLVFVLSTCSQNKHEKQSDVLDRARDKALSRIAEHYARLNDYSFVGQRCLSSCASASPQVQHFSVQLRAPGLFSIDLPDDRQQLRFDGEDFLSINGLTQVRTCRHRRVTGSEDGGFNKNSLLPYQVLSQFVVEGWRAPPLNTAHAVPAAWMVPPKAAAQHKALILSRKLSDVDLDRVEYIYRWPGVEFMEKRFIDKQGALRKRTVIEKSFRDKQAAQNYPKRWVTYDGQGQVLNWTELTDIKINQGLSKKHFRTSVPADCVPLP